MRKKHLLMALTLPALFAACSQDEALVNVEPATQYKGVPLENFTFSFNKDGNADTRMTSENWNLKWEDGDQVGLVWVNALEIQQNWGSDYDPTVLPETAFWASNTRMTCKDAASSIFTMQDGQVLEGQYFAYYPYSDRQDASSKFRLAVDKEQVQVATDLGDENGVLSYVVDNMPWVSRRANDKANGTGGTYIYPLVNDQAGMSQAINMTLYRFANMLDARISFAANEATNIDPAKVAIEKVELKVTKAANKEGYLDNIMAVSGEFNMGKLTSESNKEFGIEASTDKTKFWLPLEKSNDGIFVTKEDERVNQITTVIENPAPAVNGNRVNFLLMPYTADHGENLNNEVYTLTLVIHTNYGVAEVNEADWYRTMPGVTGLPVMGPDAVANNQVRKLQDDEDFYAGGWANRTGAFCTRYVEVNVKNLKYEARKIETQDDLIAAIERINERNEANGRYTLVIDGKEETEGNYVLDLTNFDWSADSQTSDAIKTYIANSGNLTLTEAEGKDVTIKFNGDNTIGDAKLIINRGFAGITVADGATLTVNATFNSLASPITTAETAILNVNGAKLTAGVATLNGTTNINVTDGKTGELNLSTKSVNNGTMEVYGNLSFANNAKVTNAGIINLYYTAQLTGNATYSATLNNSNRINYYYANSENKKDVTITNREDGEFVATYDGNVIPGTGDNYTMVHFLENADRYGVTHYIIAKSSEANTQSMSLTSAEKITVNNGIRLTFAPNRAEYMGLCAPNALLYIAGNSEFNKTGVYENSAKVTVKDITLAYGAVLTNNVEVEQVNDGVFQGVEQDNNANYVVNNYGSVYGGTLLNQTGSPLWKNKKYGIQ